MIKAINKITGEVIELDTDTLDEIVAAWRIAQEYSKTADALKDQLKKIVPKYVPDRTSDEVDGYMFRVNTIQRMNYSKTKLYDLIQDEDLRSEMLKPNKTFIDNWLKDNVETTGDIGVELRKSMVEDGRPYEVIKLEKLGRD